MKADTQVTPIDFPEAADRAFELLERFEGAKPLRGLTAEHQAWVMVLAVSEFVSRTMGDQHVPP